MAVAALLFSVLAVVLALCLAALLWLCTALVSDDHSWLAAGAGLVPEERPRIAGGTALSGAMSGGPT